MCAADGRGWWCHEAVALPTISSIIICSQSRQLFVKGVADCCCSCLQTVSCSHGLAKVTIYAVYAVLLVAPKMVLQQ
jgi:hypothetical protein